MSIVTSKKTYRETGVCPICRNTKGMYKQIKKLRKALEDIREHENYLGISSVYYDAQVFMLTEKALKG